LKKYLSNGLLDDKGLMKSIRRRTADLGEIEDKMVKNQQKDEIFVG
jgi:hypothetical protein